MEWIENASEFNEDFINNYHKEIDNTYFLEADLQHLEKLHELLNDLPLLPEKIKIEKSKSLYLIDFEKDFLKLINNAVSGKNYGWKMWEYTEILNSSQKNNIYKNRQFGVRTKLSYYKVFQRKFISNRNEKNSNINE